MRSFPQQSSIRKEPTNPFTYETIIQYHLSEEAQVKVSIFDFSGKLIRNLVNQAQSPGLHTTHWDGKSDSGAKMKDGTYIFLIKSNGEVVSGKMILRR